MARPTRNNKNNDNAQKGGILRLLSATTRYIKRKEKSIYKKISEKEPKTKLITKYIMKKI